MAVSVGTTELRVPGVGGSSAERILYQPTVTRVAGDKDAGFFRPKVDWRASPEPGGVILETYHWANLTGGKASRSLSFVLLLPFMLSNVAIWMLPPAPAGSGGLARAVCRLLAASLTAMYVLAVVGVAIDLVAWQCAGYSHCAADRAPMSWLIGRQPGQRLAASALVPIAAVAIVWWLGGRAWRQPNAKASPAGLGALRLESPDFWDNRALLLRLRALHAAIALGTVDIVLLGAVAPRDDRAVGYGLLALVIVVIAAAMALLCRPAWPTNPADRRVSSSVRAVWVLMLAVTALTLGYTALPRSGWSAGNDLPGYEALVAWLYVSQAVLLVVLGLSVVSQRRRLESPAILGGLGAPIVVSFAIGFGVTS
ncbi:hypothetical protein [Micromonospora sp. AMSO31t]|uniref:hypothetical protein n=1 Tax=Micromonospora sp. AMSO31t TaxID=2650566 RepID=UPI00124B7C58|nr:hypothetical protein [Micromonospora sp. AMSO31t]KAB1916289.1 hypothetical protein F8274_01015 [Micromonospora sp. AMSO31t]